VSNSHVIRRTVVKSDALKHLHPLLQRIYLARDINDAAILNQELGSLLPYAGMKNIEFAAARLARAIEEEQQILIIGDFDVDGATSSALAVSALRAMGARHVSYLVPNRFTYGYGLSPEIVVAAQAYSPNLIVTVDNGIASHAGVDKANELGVDVIITDHHLPGSSLPNAYTIVNPNQPGDQFASKNLAGVGVIFYVMLALRAYLVEQAWFSKQNLTVPNMANFLDLVALGTIADVVPLDRNNRILVHQGLRRIRAGQMGIGMESLLQVSGRRHEHIRAMDLGFAIGPRLNAAGRLDDMSLGIACLLSKDSRLALEMARQLDDLNKDRKVIELQMKQEAFSAIDQLQLSQQLPRGLCVYEESWHQGVVGLVAARVKEKTHRPVIAFAKAEDGSLKGSGRSIPGLHIRDVLESIAVNYPHLISKFGGHAMAAGLSLLPEHYPEFSKAFNEEVSKLLSEEDLQGYHETDGELTAAELQLSIADMLLEAGPFGQGFPEPVFDGVFSLVSQRLVGARHLKLVLQLPGSDHYIDAIAFNINPEEWPNHQCRTVHLVYRLDVNEFNGRRRLQLVVDALDSGHQH
jgi:single-stranded-DNA-specific exonuclease